MRISVHPSATRPLGRCCTLAPVGACYAPNTAAHCRSRRLVRVDERSEHAIARRAGAQLTFQLLRFVFVADPSELANALDQLTRATFVDQFVMMELFA